MNDPFSKLKVNLPFGFMKARGTHRQRSFLAFFIRRYKGDTLELAKMYFGPDAEASEFLRLCTQMGLHTFLRAVQLNYASRYSLGTVSYPVYVYKFHDYGRNEIKFYPAVCDFGNLEPEWIDD